MYSRAAPSARYTELIRLYRDMHERGDIAHGLKPEDTFDGRSLKPHCMTIRDLVKTHGARTLLDYGSGKGRMYGRIRIRYPDGHVVEGLREFWGVDEIRCFDPGFAEFDRLPEGTFDGVICTDVLEHCPEEDIPWILDELFSYARHFVFATVALYPAVKTLSNGANVHCTLKPAAWWREQILAAATAHRDTRYCFELEYEWAAGGGMRPPDVVAG
jgi:hypothetical protein